MLTAEKIEEEKKENSEQRNFLIHFLNTILKTTFIWTVGICITIVCASSVLLLFPIVYLFDRERHLLHTIGEIWARSILFCNPWWKINVYGRENLPKKGSAVVYVSNHQSQADILALFCLGKQFRWIAKASLFKIPFLGWGMSAVGYVPVKRGDKVSSAHSLKLSARHIGNGTSMLFFPEGTRTRTGKLGPFKSGAFRLAQSMGVPVVPITINGCTELLPKGSYVPKAAQVTIHVHPPILGDNITTDEFSEKTRECIISKLPDELK